MIRKASLLLIPLGLLVMALGVRADPALPNADTKPAEIPQNQIDGAKEILSPIPNDRQVVFNSLRFLLRPGYEAELLQGRRVRTASLEPFEATATRAHAAKPLTQAEMLRLLALLSAGFPATDPLNVTVQRLLATPIPTDNMLASSGLMALCLLHARQHPGLEYAVETQARLKELYAATNLLKDATSGRSSLIGDTQIQPQWFANHFWRAVIARATLAAGLEIAAKAWGDDLKTLSATWRKDHGFTSILKGNASPEQSWHTNLMALAAIGLALGAPDDTLQRGVLTAINENLKRTSALLETQSESYKIHSVSGSRTLLLALVPDACAPASQTPAEWRKRVIEVGVSMRDISGAVLQRSHLPLALGLLGDSSTQADAVTVETALTCIAMAGPLHGGQPLRVLSDYGAAGIGRVMYALTLLHAAGSRIGANDFRGRVNFAIEEGCAWLRSVQNPDGTFPGTYSSYTGNTAIALLAMLHGGVSRDDASIQRGLESLHKAYASELTVMYAGTYSDAIVLMFLQKYYEPEQRKSGILYADNPKDQEKARAALSKDIPEKHRNLCSQLARNLRSAQIGGAEGGYTYMAQAKTAVGGGVGAHKGDNSNSQYAMLGLKAACLLGLDIPASEFEREAKRLLAQYQPDPRLTGKVKYEHEGDERESERKTAARVDLEIQPGGWGYSIGYKGGTTMQMTAAGISSLVVCLDELKARGKLTQEFAQKIGLHIKGAEAWLADYYYTAETLAPRNGTSILTNGSDGHGAYYNLYSVERGCELAGKRMLMDRVDWYRIGAEALLDAQNIEGNWGRAREYPGMVRPTQHMTVSTCMAILFLKRASMPVITEHRKREREAAKEAELENPGEKPKGPITPGPEDKKKGGQGDK